MPYCVVIGCHIFGFTLVSNRFSLLQKIWTCKEQSVSLAIVYPSFFFLWISTFLLHGFYTNVYDLVSHNKKIENQINNFEELEYEISLRKFRKWKLNDISSNGDWETWWG